jgi:DNA adenine methylase
VTRSPRLLRPPLKLQGGKSRLLPFLSSHIHWSGSGRWVEPFFGAGAVALNVNPAKALVCDANPHLAGFHRALATGRLTSAAAIKHLSKEGRLLARRGADHFYAVRDRFNEQPCPEDLLFLNHACFNGLMRFNARGQFNTPYGQNDARFSDSLLKDLGTRIDAAAARLRRPTWTVGSADWRQTLGQVCPGDFVYLDPPYAGRYAGYFTTWAADDARALAAELRGLTAPWALSDWAADAKGPNPLLAELYPDRRIVVHEHRYVIAAKAVSRTPMTEALVLSE